MPLPTLHLWRSGSRKDSKSDGGGSSSSSQRPATGTASASRRRSCSMPTSMEAAAPLPAGGRGEERARTPPRHSSEPAEAWSPATAPVVFRDPQSPAHSTPWPDSASPEPAADPVAASSQPPLTNPRRRSVNGPTQDGVPAAPAVPAKAPKSGSGGDLAPSKEARRESPGEAPFALPNTAPASHPRDNGAGPKSLDAPALPVGRGRSASGQPAPAALRPATAAPVRSGSAALITEPFGFSGEAAVQSERYRSSSSEDVVVSPPPFADGSRPTSSSNGTRSDTRTAPPNPSASPAAVSSGHTFYFHTKPRFGKFMTLISFLLSQGQKRSLDSGACGRSEIDQAQYKKLLSVANVIRLCDAATNILSREPSMLRINVNVNREDMVVVGDLHGQFNDLYHSVLSQQYSVASKNKMRKDKTFLFLGDFVDRGPHSLETILLVLALKVEFPHLIFAIRGNHEEKTTSRIYGFFAEAQVKFGKADGTAIWEVITSTFASLPLAAVVTVENKKTPARSFTFFATHGGLSPDLLESLDSIKDIKRERYGLTRDRAAVSFLPVDGSLIGGGSTALPLSQKEEEVCKGLMWSDPTNDTGLFSRNPRGCGFLFGPLASEKFCETNEFNFIVRAHQVVMDGYLWKHGERVLTIFSAPNYCGINGNLGALMLIRGDAPLQADGSVSKASTSVVSSNSLSVSRPLSGATTLREMRASPFNEFLTFVQYDSADRLADENDVPPPSMNFPHASWFV